MRVITKLRDFKPCNYKFLVFFNYKNYKLQNLVFVITHISTKNICTLN